jgi:hypothetical protein
VPCPKGWNPELVKLPYLLTGTYLGLFGAGMAHKTSTLILGHPGDVVSCQSVRLQFFLNGTYLARRCSRCYSGRAKFPAVMHFCFAGLFLTLSLLTVCDFFPRYPEISAVMSWKQGTKWKWFCTDSFLGEYHVHFLHSVKPWSIISVFLDLVICQVAATWIMRCDRVLNFGHEDEGWLHCWCVCLLKICRLLFRYKCANCLMTCSE